LCPSQLLLGTIYIESVKKITMKFDKIINLNKIKQLMHFAILHTIQRFNPVCSKALHSELLTELSSLVLSQNEFSQVRTSSEKAQKTRSDPNFWKTAISETRENKKFGKTRLLQGLSVQHWQKLARA